MKNITVLVVLAFILIMISLKGGGREEKNSSGCPECHKAILADSVKHAPLFKCEGCHKVTGAVHPDTITKAAGFSLQLPVPGLCYTCHSSLNTKSSVHPPVASGKCFSCHDPHSAGFASLLKYPKETICLECHETDVSAKKSQHKAFTDGKCSACHDPHQADGKKLVKKESASLCLECHSSMKNSDPKGSVHPPAELNCMICHTGHSSDEPYLLKEPSNALCLECHDDIANPDAEFIYTHKALQAENGCISCHSPHFSSGKKLLPEDEKSACLKCHNVSSSEGKNVAMNMKEIIRTRKYLHGAIDSLGCSSCHPPHAAKFPSLLIAAFPKGNYSVSVRDSSALCFTCHDPKLISDSGDLNNTNFRNGNKNLHFWHTRGNNGRNCRACHDVHAANNKAMIAETVPFGQWKLPINFHQTATGGSCTPGCHNEREYNR